MEKLFVRFATLTAKIAGKPWTFILCLATVIVWAVSGPIFQFNETWQLVINTGTTIVTFLMVFLIQNTQNRDGAAMQAKLDELVFAVKQADARFIGIEHLTEKELDAILSEVERRGLAIHAGKPARPIGGAPGKRADAIEESQPRAASPDKPAARNTAPQIQSPQIGGKMTSLAVTLVGSAAALCSITSFAPQIIKIWKERDASAVSLKTYSLTVTCFILWVVYGVMTEAWPITVANGFALVMACGVLGMKWCFRDSEH